MRHRRKTHKKKHHTKRRKSAIHGIDVKNILGVVVGAVAAGYLDKVIPDSIDTKIVAGGKIALGVALPMLVKGGDMKNMLSGVGAGMIAVGSIDLLKGFGVLGYETAMGDDALEISLNGDMDILAGDDLSVINENVLSGDDDISVVSGDDDEDAY
jgi:hypothetical protein